MYPKYPLSAILPHIKYPLVSWYPWHSRAGVLNVRRGSTLICRPGAYDSVKRHLAPSSPSSPGSSQSGFSVAPCAFWQRSSCASPSIPALLLRLKGPICDIEARQPVGRTEPGMRRHIRRLRADNRAHTSGSLFLGRARSSAAGKVMWGDLPPGLCNLGLVTQTRRLRPKVNHDSHALCHAVSRACK